MGRGELLDALDEVLVAVRRAPYRPAYRRRFLGRREFPREMGTVRVLRAVRRAEEAAPSIGDIAISLAVDPSTASRMIDRCVQAGLIERVVQPRDRRRAHLRLTESGTELLKDLSRNRRKLLAEVTDGWSEGDLERAVGLLQKLRAGFDRLEESE